MNEYQITRYRDVVQERLGVSHQQMVDRFYQEQGARLVEAREAIRRNVRTVADWQTERRALRRRLVTAIGGPSIHDRLRIEVRGEVQKRDLLVKKLLFSPFEDHWIPANLFLPLSGDRPFPGVVLPAGHSIGGMGGYAPLAVYFALNGYAALTFDFIGGGERAIPMDDGRMFAPASGQHCIVGTKMGLHGYNLQWFMAYDTMAAVSALLSFPEVDSGRIAMTGSSGGGTETFFASALDERVKVIAPAASVHSFRNKLYPDDTEQALFNPIRNGLDYPDIACFLIAPRPVLIVANTSDIWDIAGTRYVYDEARRFYRLLGSEDAVAIRVWEKGHACDWDQVQVILEWFNHRLPNDRRPVSWEDCDQSNVPDEAECIVSAKRNLYLDGYPTPTAVFTAHVRGRQTARSSKHRAISRLLRSVRAGLKKRVRWDEIDRYPVGDFEGRRLVFSPEDGLLLPAEMLIPQKPRGIMVLLDEIARMEAIEWQIEAASKGYAALRPDMRGFGETSPEERWNDWENWSHALYMGKRYTLAALMQLVGKQCPLERARDVLALLSVARTIGIKGKTVLWGRRAGALVALLAGLADPEVDELILEKHILSFAQVAAADIPVGWPDSFLHGILRDGIDVADLRRAFRPRKLRWLSPLDAMSRPTA